MPSRAQKKAMETRAIDEREHNIDRRSQVSGKDEVEHNQPKKRRAAPNAGVLLVGDSTRHGCLPATMLGGRWYTGKKVYVYTDFGGGVDKDEMPEQGAFREFVEELLGMTGEEAKDTARKLCTRCSLVGGRYFLHKGYAIFIVSAKDVVKTLEVTDNVEGISAIDYLFDLAKQNSELTSVAMVSLQELLKGSLSGGSVRPLITRQLDGQDRCLEVVQLRDVMVGSGGSIQTIRDVLEAFIFSEPLEDKPCALDSRNDQEEPCNAIFDGMWEQLEKASSSSKPRQRRWKSSIAGNHKSSSSSSKVTLSQASSAKEGAKRMPFVFDMETGDPDDVLTLLLMGSHPNIELRAVTVTPGSLEQIALVRWLLHQMDLAHVRLGAQDWPANARKPINLGTSFYKSFGRMPEGEPACERADLVLLECCDDSVTLVTGAALHNLGNALKHSGFHLGRWVAQGGFAGEGVVPRELQMDKFKGMEVCSTWNFCGNIPAAQAALASSVISRKICVSKNVCHSVNYDAEFHATLGAAAETEAKMSPKGRRAVVFHMIYKTMDDYLRHKPGGKKLHDPLALAVAIDESVCEMAEVEIYCQKGKWGSRLSTESNIFISIAYDVEKFVIALLR
jgi:pyrimidine-specific ribonucleoside hydrolase